MPEGDTLYRSADRLGGALVGETVERVYGSHRAVREFGRRVAGTIVVSVETRGKHLLVHFDNDWTLRTHLQMPGVWHLYERDEPWRKTPGKARAVVETPRWAAVCFSAPTVQLAPRRLVTAAVDHLGPDLLDDDFDPGEVLRRTRLPAAGPTAADLLLDQTVMAGVGNVYKSEVLYLEGVHPGTTVETMDDALITRLVERSRRSLLANRTAMIRTTTGDRRRDAETWVYGRGGLPCRRCGTAIADGRHGPLNRITYWCPSCQPQTDP